ncbi:MULTISPECIES: DUF6431 domain-containing protein [Blautia]
MLDKKHRYAEFRRYYNELPDCLVPHKHYEAKLISGEIDGV